MTIGLIFAICLGAVHLLASRQRWLAAVPAQRRISFGAGVSIAYVFVEVLPSLRDSQEQLQTVGGFLLEGTRHHVYLLALAGLVAFFGLELLARRSCARNRAAGAGNATSADVFWVHMSAFAVYNGLLGYLLRDAEKHGLLTCLLLFVALALHFSMNDYALYLRHQAAYARIGRWVLALAVVVGYAIGLFFPVGEGVIAALWAVLAGGLILNSLKDELPERGEASFATFLVGLVGYAALLVWLAHLDPLA
jgi:hypothetical protein